MFGDDIDFLSFDDPAYSNDLNNAAMIFLILGMFLFWDMMKEITGGVCAAQGFQAAGIHVVTHIIIGLPGDDPVATTRYAVACGTDGVKFHPLHVLRGTDLEKDYLAGRFSCLTLEEYAYWLQRCLDVLPREIVLHRITGDGAKRDLVAPMWSADKKRVLNYLREIL